MYVFWQLYDECHINATMSTHRAADRNTHARQKQLRFVAFVEHAGVLRGVGMDIGYRSSLVMAANLLADNRVGECLGQLHVDDGLDGE